jgi:hypothetical protein
MHSKYGIDMSVSAGLVGLECICLLLAYKIKYPGSFHLLIGKSDYAQSSPKSNFHEECLRRCVQSFVQDAESNEVWIPLL